MKKLIIVLIGSCLFLTKVNAQFTRYIVRLKDKGGNPFSLSNSSAYLSQRAISRRTRYNIAIDSTDLPITQKYIDSIKNVPNVTVLNKSKWLNMVAISTTDAAALARINSFPFVQSTNPIAARVSSGNSEIQAKFRYEKVDSFTHPQNARIAGPTMNYGQTSAQINFHNGQFLHDLGFRGENMIIAMIDGGFMSYKTNPAFDSIRLNSQVIGEWNFVNNIQNTDGFSGHGMNCLSTIAANRPGVMIGTAPHAKFWLFVTEDGNSEYPIEEVNWAAGAEFADSVGVDVISSSLGYQDFDNSSFDYLYAQRNGNTAISTHAADLAAKKGMIVMVSAGNYGGLTDQRKYVSCPADGDSVVAVGATNSSGAIASFSSWGPNSAGKIKPNIVSIGQGTIVSDFNGNPITGSGTSFSNPNIAGLITALWGAFPEFSNMEIINAVQQSADKFSNPDDRYGYGIPDMKKAYYLLKAKKNLQTPIEWIKVLPNPFNSELNLYFRAQVTGNVSLKLLDVTGRLINTKSIAVQKDNIYYSYLEIAPKLNSGIYILRFNDGMNRRSIKVFKK